MGWRRSGRRVLGLAIGIALVLGAVPTGPAGSTGWPGPERRPLLVILFTDPQYPALAHRPAYYQHLVAAADPSIAGYYRAQSQGRFTYTPAGVVAVTDPGPPSGLGTGSRERAVALAARSGAFGAYDTDHDGTVTERELTVLVVDNLSAGAGATRRVCRPAGPVRYCANVASVGHRSSLQNYVHELAHTLTPPAVDLYGPAHRCLSRGVTLMSCTAGAADDPTRLMGLDPVHRREYGWLVPPSAPAPAYVPGRRGSFVLQPGAVPDPVLISDGYAVDYRRPGGTERLTFEVRRASPVDTRLPASGLYVWFDDGGFPSARIPSLSTPGESDPAAFVLGPDHCVLAPMSRTGRGRAEALAPGTYRLHWLDDRDSGTLLTVRPADRAGRVRLDLRPSSAVPSCSG